MPPFPLQLLLLIVKTPPLELTLNVLLRVVLALSWWIVFSSHSFAVLHSDGAREFANKTKKTIELTLLGLFAELLSAADTKRGDRDVNRRRRMDYCDRFGALMMKDAGKAVYSKVLLLLILKPYFIGDIVVRCWP